MPSRRSLLLAAAAVVVLWGAVPMPSEAAAGCTVLEVQSGVNKLVPAGAQAGDQCGYRMAFDGTVLVAMSRQRSTPSRPVHMWSTTTNGDPTSAYVERAEVVPTDIADADRSSDEWAESLAISGDVLAVGASRHARVAARQGHVMIYTPTSAGDPAGGWTERAHLRLENITYGPSASHDQRFGEHIALSGTTLASFVYRAQHQGGTYVSIVSANTTGDATSGWAERAKLNPGEVGARGAFGSVLAIDGTLLAVTARQFTSSAPRGKVYIYSSVVDGDPTSGWLQRAALAPTLDASGWTVDDFGNALAVSGTTVAVGAPGNKRDTRRSGAVHIYVPSTPGDVSSTWTLVQSLYTSKFTDCCNNVSRARRRARAHTRGRMHARQMVALQLRRVARRVRWSGGGVL